MRRKQVKGKPSIEEEDYFGLEGGRQGDGGDDQDHTSRGSYCLKSCLYSERKIQKCLPH